jgi:hypothetical protein
MSLYLSDQPASGKSQSFSDGPSRGPVPPAVPAAGAMGPPPVLTCDGVEVTQSIQNMAHAVPLVAKKATTVRVYLSVAAAAPITVRGVLWMRSPAGSGAWTAVASLGTVAINPAENGNLRLKREQVAKSLNFVLPIALIRAGSCELVLEQVTDLNPPQNLAVPAHSSRTVTFVDTAPLRVHILGIRYKSAAPNPVGTFEPALIDYTLIQSWLGRAYPVSEVIFSRVTVDGPNAWPFDAAAMNAFVRGVRFQEVQHGTDHRTHYFGLVSDAGGPNFMRGLASGVPTTPDPSTVASGPTGSNNWGWDFDGSYGDWYTGHELGHTFGRFHAEFCGATGGAPYPFANGQLSNADEEFVGFDTGDAAHSATPMQAMPGTVWHDVMTYCQFQWLSSFTYTGLRDRIQAESLLSPGAPAPGPAPALPVAALAGGGPPMPATGAIHVVATVNVTKGTGAIRHVSAYAAPPAGGFGGPGPGAAPASPYTLRLLKDDGTEIGVYPAAYYSDTCRDPGEDETGIVDTSIPGNAAAARLELLAGGKVLASYAAGVTAKPVTNIQAIPPAAAPGVSPGAAHPVAPRITWTDQSVPHPAPAAPAAAAVGHAAPSGPTYSVEISTDNGQTWRTVGYGLTQPGVTLDRHLLSGANQVLLRITTTDGFRQAVSTKTFASSAL